jgi:trehalose 6-phosphate synthase
MPDRRKLILVSNRGPVTFSLDSGGKRIAARGGGGLVTALSGVIARHDVTWIASAMSDEDRGVASEHGDGSWEDATADGNGYRLRLVAHDPQAYDRYYNVVANPVLWFIQHYLWDLVNAQLVDQGLHEAWSEGYAAVNASFADAVLDELERTPDGLVLFHDYHFYIAPGLVREAAPDAAIAHFVHIPWAQPDYWRVLPEPIRRAVHEGLLASDVVGFHTSRWRRNFLRSCEDITGAEVDFATGEVRRDDRTTYTRVRPISVDAREFDDLASSEAVRAEERSIEDTRREFLIVRVDRTDPSKNIVRGFRAYELLLEAHPELHERVTMLALLDPSRQDIPEYSEYIAAIQRAARVVNDRFGHAGWMPLEVSIEDNLPRAVAAYKQYDALLVNAIFDGMNLVAKEAPLVNERDGVLVLSENTGAHEELGDWVLTVNPFDVTAQAEALHEALTMSPDERGRRHRRIREHVRSHGLDEWIDSQLRDLDEVLRRAKTRISA